MMGEKEIMAAASIGAPEDAGVGDETSRLRESIAETRENIESTIEALQEKLSPGAIAEQAKTVVREATIGKVENMVHEAQESITRTSYSLYDSVRQNPVPLLMAGIGLAWFFMSRRRDQRYFMGEGEGGRPGYEDRYRGDEDLRGGERRGKEGITTRVREAAHDVAEKAGELVHGNGHGPGVAGKAREAKETVKREAHEAKETVKRVAREATERGRDIENRVEDMFYQNPLAAGAIVMAAGTAIGLAIPISHKEEEWMGPARDKLVGKANELAQQALGKVEDATARVQEVAGRVEGAARDVGQSTSHALGAGGS
jgi:ElaB/YqjD/DUF883 family membrane-anchored ribosome-binding protein